MNGDHEDDEIIKPAEDIPAIPVEDLTDEDGRSDG